MKDFLVNTLILCLIVVIGSVMTYLLPDFRGAIVGLMVSTAFFCGECRGESK